MTLRHYQIFVMVCDEMNMSAAANKLFMSQSAVSQAVSELERYYEVRLFERLSRKLYLTQAGNKLLGYARHIIHMNETAEKEMRALNQNSTIRIGASVTIGACILPKLIASYRKVQSEFSVEVTEDNTAQIEQLLLCDKLDLGLVEGEIISDDIKVVPFSDDNLILICGKNHPLWKQMWIEAKALEQENFILREVGSGTRKTFEEVMQKYNLIWTSTWTCNNADTIKTAVAEGLGVSVISQRAVIKEIEEGILHGVTIKDMEFHRQFKIAFHKNKYLTDNMNNFIEYTKSYEAGSEVLK